MPSLVTLQETGADPRLWVPAASREPGAGGTPTPSEQHLLPGHTAQAPPRRGMWAALGGRAHCPRGLGPEEVR